MRESSHLGYGGWIYKTSVVMVRWWLWVSWSTLEEKQSVNWVVETWLFLSQRQGYKEDQGIFFAFKESGVEEKVSRIGRISGRKDLVVLRSRTGMRPGHNWGAKPSESPITRHLWFSLKNQSCSMPTMQRRPQCQAVYPRQVTALLMDAASSPPFPVSGSQPLPLLSHTPKALVTSEGEIHFKTHL